MVMILKILLGTILFIGLLLTIAGLLAGGNGNHDPWG
jgi:hypothetical protein